MHLQVIIRKNCFVLNFFLSEDEDGDGVKDVNQISPKELAIRKSLLFLRTVDPNKITAAVYGIQTSFLAVAATLKLVRSLQLYLFL